MPIALVLTFISVSWAHLPLFIFNRTAFVIIPCRHQVFPSFSVILRFIRLNYQFLAWTFLPFLASGSLSSRVLKRECLFCVLWLRTPQLRPIVLIPTGFFLFQSPSSSDGSSTSFSLSSSAALVFYRSADCALRSPQTPICRCPHLNALSSPQVSRFLSLSLIKFLSRPGFSFARISDDISPS